MLKKIIMILVLMILAIISLPFLLAGAFWTIIVILITLGGYLIIMAPIWILAYIENKKVKNKDVS